MAIAGVGAAQSAQGSTSVNQTRTAGAVNNVIIVGCIVASVSATPSVSDTQGNNWIPMNLVFHDGTNVTSISSFYCFAKNTLSTTITMAGNGGGVFVSMSVDEFSGIDLDSPVDKVFNTLTGASGTPTSPSFGPSFNNELVWGYVADTATAVGNIDGSAATKGGDDGLGDWSEYRILSGRAGVGMTLAFAGSGAYNLIGASFKADGVLGQLRIPNSTRMRVRR